MTLPLKVCDILYDRVKASEKASEKASVQNKKVLQVCNRLYLKKLFVFSKTNSLLNNVLVPIKPFSYTINVNIINFGGCS